MQVNWTAVGASGEIVGALAVVLTLLYLSRQIRENSRALQVAALRDTTAQWNQWSELLASSPELAAIVVDGNRSYHDLAADRALRYAAFVQAFFDIVESNRALIAEHRIEKDIGVLESILARRLALTGFSEWWDENLGDYDEEFRRWVEAVRTRQTT